MTLAFQDSYPERFRHCFGCGRGWSCAIEHELRPASTYSSTVA